MIDTPEKLYLTPRRGKWLYRRRVPVAVQALDGRKTIERTTKQPVANVAEACRIAREFIATDDARWALLMEGAAPSGVEVAHRKAVERARRVGFAYRTAAELAAGPLDDILARVHALDAGGLSRSPQTIRAVLGTVDPPSIQLSQLATRYFELTRDLQRDQRKDTNRNWRNRRRRAVEIAVDQVGDVPLADIGRSEALGLRDWLLDQVEARKITAPYANKIISVLSTMTRTVSDALRLNLANPFQDLRLANAQDDQRPPFDPDYVQTTLLGPSALLAMNIEARAVIALIASTGMRPIEFARLRPGNMKLDAPVPHISIRATGRSRKEAAEAGLKVQHTARDIPLFGSALAAAKLFANGPVRYKDKNDSMTAAIGAYLRENELLPTPQHSLYSLRHTFKDRLRAIKAPEELIDQVMGHKTRKPAYGDGYPLDVLAEFVERVAFDPPDWLEAA